MNGICTRCTQVGEIRLSGTLDWDVPYALCANTGHSPFRSLPLASHRTATRGYPPVPHRVAVCMNIHWREGAIFYPTGEI